MTLTFYSEEQQYLTCIVALDLVLIIMKSTLKVHNPHVISDC